MKNGAYFLLTTALRSTRARTWSTFPEMTRGKMDESAPLQNRQQSPEIDKENIVRKQRKQAKQSMDLLVQSLLCVKSVVCRSHQHAYHTLTQLRKCAGSVCEQAGTQLSRNAESWQADIYMLACFHLIDYPPGHTTTCGHWQVMQQRFSLSSPLTSSSVHRDPTNQLPQLHLSHADNAVYVTALVISEIATQLCRISARTHQKQVTLHFGALSPTVGVVTNAVLDFL